MPHLDYRSDPKVPNVPDAWLAATANATEYAIKISGVHDLAVKVGPGFAAEAGTAQFNPFDRLIQVDTNVMLPGVKAEDVKLRDPLFSARFPLFKGSLVHEAAHARYTRWVPRDLHTDGGYTPQMIDVVTLLEESRIEKRMMKHAVTDAQAYLPAIVFDLLAKDFKISESPYGAAATAALILARVDAGSITITEAKPFRALVLTVLSEDQLATLQGLWREYHALPFFQYDDLPHAAMQSIARRWLEVVGIDPDAQPEEGAGAPELAADGASGEGESGKSDEAGAPGKAGEAGEGFADKVREAAAGAKHNQDQKHAEKVGKIKVERMLEEREADAERHKAGESAAKEAFEDERVIPGHGKSLIGNSKYFERTPTAAEVGAAGIFAKKLERVLYTARRVFKINTEAPGGRLRGRAAMAGDAQRAQGMEAKVKPWRQRKVVVTDEPTIRLGLVTDISGSMAAAAEPMGSAAYIIGNGVNRADGIFSSVVFGSRIYGVIKPRQEIKTVPVVYPRDGFEAFKDAFLALDSALDLLDGEGLKILVLASDGHFVDDQHAKYADLAMRLCEKKGVLVLHLDFSGTNIVQRHDAYLNLRHGNKTPPLNIPEDSTPQEVAAMVGDFVVQQVAVWKAKQRA